MKYLTVIFFFCLLSLTGYSQPSCLFTEYSSENGLSQNTVMTMLQDHRGVIWLATWDGINKFDGYTFKTYKARSGNLISLTNNRVDCMKEDKYGYIWVMTYDNHAHRFDPRTETFEQVPSSGWEATVNISTIEILPNGSVWLLTENEGAIRVITDEKTHELSTEIYSIKSGPFPAKKVYKVCLDAAGNEWMLTNNGLCVIREGGSAPVSYFVESQETHQGLIQSFYSFLDWKENIYFGSDKGRMWVYQKKDGRFHLQEFPVKGNILSIEYVGEDELVIATRSEGFYIYNLKNKELVSYNKQTHKDFPDAVISSVYKDRYDELWFELHEIGGILHFNPLTKELKHEIVPVESSMASRAQPAFHILEDIKGRLWVHPYGGGLSYYDRTKKKLSPFYNAPGASDWKFSNKLHSILSDRQGNLWMCTHSKDLEKVTFLDNQFDLGTPFPHDYETLDNEVRSICEDKDRYLWVGFKGGKIIKYDRNKKDYGYLTEAGTFSHSGKPLYGVPYSIIQAKDGAMWIATKGEGIVRVERNGDNSYKLMRFKYDADDIYSLSNDNVYWLCQDAKGRIWVATFGGGINYVEKDKNGKYIFINHRNNLKGYPIDQCYRARNVVCDYQGNIWVGTTTGVVCFKEDFVNPEEVVFQHYSRDSEDANSLNNNDIYSVLPTRDKDVYFATFGGGLNKFISPGKSGKGEFKAYTVENGMPSDVLMSLQEDSAGNLWMSTENGLCKFIPSQERFENYDDEGFEQKVRFNEAASAKLSDNKLAFGANSGLLVFTPDSIKKSTYVPDIIFSKLLLSNIEVIPGDGSLIKAGLDYLDKLVLSHKENIFTIQYASLDMRNSENIRYAYILEGFEKEWTYVDKQRSATYTNLPKGDYVFRVKSTNSDGVWVDNVRSLPITVLPSFWETPWAYLLYVLFIVIIILVAVYILFTIYRLKHEVSVEQQISDIKLRFFTNISHELRTPLTLISGPVEYILKNSKLPDDAREQLKLVERNTDRMLRLVNQILDFRKIQNKKMKMRVQEIEVISFIRRIMDSFETLAAEHKIAFVLKNENGEINLWADADKLEKIIFNLLSNAFKYTPHGKKITVFVEERGENILIGVRDQGIGIAEDKRNSIFVRFENLMDKNLFNQPTSGIGLSLVKELVEMHGGTITVDSKLGEGSCFTVSLLKGKVHYDESVEFILADSSVVQSVEKVVPDEVADLNTKEEQQEWNEEDNSKELMLLVEDNTELRFFLKSLFVSSYRIVEAADGEEGLEKALKYIPDIIISDVMMDRKDGIELTKDLRSNVTTSHIPIILLTAKSNIESKLEGLELGADDYITKPFSATYLTARIQNLLAQRKKLQEIYCANLMVPKTEDLPQEPEMSSHDRKFMDKLLELMEKNMDNGELIVDDLVRELAVSRSVFFKKLKVLTGLAPIEFIREMRIKRAAGLIETGEYNMTQVAYMVGINDPRYFSKCFKQKYGMTPTEYKEKVHPVKGA